MRSVQAAETGIRLNHQVSIVPDFGKPQWLLRAGCPISCSAGWLGTSESFIGCFALRGGASSWRTFCLLYTGMHLPPGSQRANSSSNSQ
jgi:hypothetical protein